MKRSEIDPMPEYFDRYINLAADVELSQAFDDSIAQLESLDVEKLTRLENRPYAEGKWPVQGIFQHIIDFEWVFNYRSLLFARKTGLAAQSLEEDEIADASKADTRKVADLIAELITLRKATKAMYASFDEEMLNTVGVGGTGKPISVLAVAFTSIGHQVHHLNVLNERYMPLLDNE
jgi:DinB superfamily